jgi:hypothetical protein
MTTTKVGFRYFLFVEWSGWQKLLAAQKIGVGTPLRHNCKIVWCGGSQTH